MTQQGVDARARGDVDVALRRFKDALEIDATFEQAYLELASLREATGELEEAEHVLAIGMERIPGFTRAAEARAALLSRARRFDEATDAYSSVLRDKRDDAATLTRLVEVAPHAGQFLVALAAARRLFQVASGQGNAQLASDARLSSRALSLLVGELDPVTSGRRSPNPVRRAIARASM
ncbi:MAG: tetratricopeptide repeat protein [Polyangiaceae bacterium]